MTSETSQRITRAIIIAIYAGLMSGLYWLTGDPVAPLILGLAVIAEHLSEINHRTNILIRKP